MAAAAGALALVPAAGPAGAESYVSAWASVGATATRSNIDLSKSGMFVGVTHEKASADNWENLNAVYNARKYLISDVRLQNQHLMGFGVSNPEPADNVYNWSSLDDRMSLIKSTGGTPILTLAGAPDWMKGGKPYEADWSKIEVAPLPQYYQAFADLSVAALKRYSNVRYVQVWNELKGFYDATRNTWNIEGYTQLYNMVYKAIKAYNPAIKVGGPYVVMDSWSSASVMSHPSAVRGDWGVVDRRALDAIDYWLANKAGADFISVDGTSATRDKGVITTTAIAAKKFSAINAWIKTRTTLPIWWSEVYTPALDGTSTPTAFDQSFAELKTSGARVALLWDPQHESGEKWAWLWTDTSVSTGGQPGPYKDVWRKYAATTTSAVSLS